MSYGRRRWACAKFGLNGYLLEIALFKEIEIDELGRDDSGMLADFYQLGRFEKCSRALNGGPSGEVDDLERIADIFQDLIGAFARLLPHHGSCVKNRFPSGVVGDLVDDQDFVGLRGRCGFWGCWIHGVVGMSVARLHLRG